jgi:hypothetical protein
MIEANDSIFQIQPAVTPRSSFLAASAVASNFVIPFWLFGISDFDFPKDKRRFN